MKTHREKRYEMAVFRQIHIDFWQDGFILDLTPEEKYFYLYLMTNSKTTQCGVYELPKRIIETETGYNRETIEKLLDRFKDYEKIIYDKDTNEIFIYNWVKYNKIVSPKVKKCVEKELRAIKSKKLINLFLNECSKYGYSIDTLSIPIPKVEINFKNHYGEEKEKKEKE
ncbi:replication protein [Paraclostridium sordellii]|nr:replication protein [Paeniclostridium sordellii]